MKADMITTVQILLILMFLVGVIAYAVASVKHSIIEFKYNIVKRISSRFLDFSRIMALENFCTFQKYDIWRYCVHF